MIGIIKVVNNKNNKIYLAKSTNVNNSISVIRYKLKNNIPLNRDLQLDYNEKYYSYEVIKNCLLEDLDNTFNYYKELYKDNLYNVFDTSKHPWHLQPVVLNLSPKTELITDVDGDILPLKYCVQCNLYKLEDSFIASSFYCRTCRDEIESEEIEIEEILSSIVW